MTIKNHPNVDDYKFGPKLDDKNHLIMDNFSIFW